MGCGFQATWANTLGLAPIGKHDARHAQLQKLDVVIHKDYASGSNHPLTIGLRVTFSRASSALATGISARLRRIEAPGQIADTLRYKSDALHKPRFTTRAGYVDTLKYVHCGSPLAERTAGSLKAGLTWILNMQHERRRTIELDCTAGDAVSSKIARNCLLTRSRQISRVLTAIYDEALRPFSIVAPQFSLLVLVAELGPLSRSDLGRRNHHDRSTLSRNLQPLISQGWIVEGAPGNDGRSRPLSLTEAGKALLGNAASAWSAAQTQATALLGEAGAKALMNIAGELPLRMS